MVNRMEPPAIGPGQVRSCKPPSRSAGLGAGAVAAAPSWRSCAATAALLGGPKVLRCKSFELVDVHHAILQGLPAATLMRLKKSLVYLDMADLARTFGVSERTIRRHVERNSERLGTALGSKVWRFAELLARATMVFGGQEKAERWMNSNVMGLDGWRPIDLLQTSVGAQLMDDFLGRLEYGVYT